MCTKTDLKTIEIISEMIRESPEYKKKIRLLVIEYMTKDILSQFPTNVKTGGKNNE